VVLLGDGAGGGGEIEDGEVLPPGSFEPTLTHPATGTPVASAMAESPGLARTDAPSFLARVKNFAVAAAGHVAAGMPMASDEEILRRHDICRSCEFLQDNACTKCGCPVVRERGYVSKLSWADQECPIGKWGKATPSGPSGP